MRPHVGMQQLAQPVGALEGDLALADPFQNGIAPLPLRAQPLVPFGQLHGEFELAVLQHLLGGIARRQHVLGFRHHRSQVGRFLGRARGPPTN